jgi:hypothetical protein
MNPPTTLQKSDAIGEEPVIVVCLRQPRMARRDEMRSDPFWEFGSFGITGCHARNLMNPAKAGLLEGARFAFAQGGNGGFRLVLLTPPLAVVRHRELVEVRWQPAVMPFRYWDAPVLMDRAGRSEVLDLPAFLQEVNRNGWPAKFASKFRSRRQPLPANLARQLAAMFDGAIAQNSAGSCMARSYEEALPQYPPKIDYSRRQTYSRLLAEAR